MKKAVLCAGALVLAGAISNTNLALAQAEGACPLPAGMAPLTPPSVTAQQVEDGSASLMEFALAARERYMSLGQEVRTLEGAAYLQCRIREEGSPWRSGSTYLVFLTPDGRVFEHAKSMALSGRKLHLSIYGAILQALGIDPNSLADPAAAFAAFAAAAAGNGGSFNVPDVPGASGYAAVFTANPQIPILLAGFEIDESHLAEEEIDYGNPSITAAEVVDRRTLKAFVNEAIKYFFSVLETNDPAAISKLRIALRDPNGPWRHGPVYLYALERTSNLIWFHGAFPDRFEYRPLVPTVRDAVTGKFILTQVIEAAESSPEGGFVEYYFDDPTDDTDSADVPKTGYARQFAATVRRADGIEFTLDFIVGSGFYGRAAPEAVAGDHDAVIESILPQVMRAMTASTVDAVSRRIDAAASGAAPTQEMSLGGASTLEDVLMANGQALEAGTFDPGQLLAGSSFTLPLGASGSAEAGLFGDLTLWGSGDWRNISGGERQGVGYDGSVLSASLGIDTRLGSDLLAGVSLGRSRGAVDYTQGSSRGEFTATVTSVNPYVGWQAADGMSLWAMAGQGWGEVEIEDAAGPQSSDLTQRMAAAGLSGTLLSSDELIAGGTTRVRVRGDAAFTKTEVDGSGTIAAVELEAGRHRLTVEGSHTRRLASGALVTPSVEVGMRSDVGDGETGDGVEAGGGVRYADEATGLTVEGRARTLVGHSGTQEEWGVSGLVRLDPGAAGRGLALSVRPSWGETASGVDRLWRTGVVPGSSPAGRLDARVGYGMALLDGHFTGTPQLGLGLSGSGHEWRLGWTLGLAETRRVSFLFGLEATRWEPANDAAAPENRVGITASLRW